MNSRKIRSLFSRSTKTPSWKKNKRNSKMSMSPWKILDSLPEKNKHTPSYFSNKKKDYTRE